MLAEHQAKYWAEDVDVRGKQTRDAERTGRVCSPGGLRRGEPGGERGEGRGSRGAPSYSFGPKEGLYRAVVERMADDVRASSRPEREERDEANVC